MASSKSFEKLMNQSLEDYIKDSGLTTTPPNKHIITSDDEDDLLGSPDEPLKVEKNEKMSDEDNDDDALEMVVDDEEMVVFERQFSTPKSEEKPKNPFKTVEYMQGSHTHSQQWRLEPENRVSQRPAGMPPTVPMGCDVMANLYEDANGVSFSDARQKINHNFRKRNNISFTVDEEGSSKRSYNHNNLGCNRQNNRRRRPYNNRNDRRNNNIQPWAVDNQFDRDRLFNQQSLNLGRAIPFGSTQSLDALSVRNLLQNNNNGGHMSAMNNIQALLNPNRMQVPANNLTRTEDLDCLLQDLLMSFSTQISPADRDVFNSILMNIMRARNDTAQLTRQGNMSNQEKMALAANSVLEHIKTIEQNFGNKYDMKVQKEIAALQGKCLTYRCNGNQTTAVVSFDGPGIDETFKPTTTDTTMNQRFA